MTRRFLLILTIVLIGTFYFAPQPKAEAFDPVTLAILTPLAIQGAKILAPYVIRGLKNVAVVGVRSAKYLLKFFLVPVGLVECIIMPWRISTGLSHMGQGFIGLFCFVGNLCLIPVAIFGVGV
ncbi:MAG: hypothetical protein IJT68_09465 [Lentisphaeria bacterium]|jgi:hypothetical protein|nr:hypothetical protein [Lentisphaeria bacterium]MBR3506974.1 hypothetical protein [Lentisphaeria bacterium]